MRQGLDLPYERSRPCLLTIVLLTVGLDGRAASLTCHAAVRTGEPCGPAGRATVYWNLSPTPAPSERARSMPFWSPL